MKNKFKKWVEESDWDEELIRQDEKLRKAVLIVVVIAWIGIGALLLMPR